MMRLDATEVDDHRGWLLAVATAGLAAIALARFGLPPVSLHEPLHEVGIMDPLCGMTRATRLFARGDLRGAWRYNPGSYLLAMFAFAAVLRAAAGAVTGRWWRVAVDRRVEVVLSSSCWVCSRSTSSCMRRCCARG